MNRIFRSLPAFATLATIAFAPVAHAQTTTYNTQAAFLARVASGSYLENFNTTNSFASSINFSGGSGFAYTASVTGGFFPTPGTTGNGLGGANSNAAITFTFTGASVSAIGGNFFAENVSGAYTPANITINLSNGFATTLTTPALTAFNGFSVATGSIASFTVNTPSNGNFAIIDNLIVGRFSPAPAVPEPGNIALLAGMSVTGAGFLVRRRHASAQKAA